MDKNTKIVIVINILMILISVLIIILGINYFKNEKNRNIERKVRITNENIIKNEVISNSVENKLESVENDVKNESGSSNWTQATEGIITKIGEGFISIKSGTEGHETNIITEGKTFTNYRTGEQIMLSDINVGDYCISSLSINIIRNISGEEWKLECLKNMTETDNHFSTCGVYKIGDFQEMEDYLLMDFTIQDSTKTYFTDNDQETIFDIKLKVPTTLEIASHSNITIYNLKERQPMTWIELDENTLNDKYPTVKTIEVYDG